MFNTVKIGVIYTTEDVFKTEEIWSYLGIYLFGEGIFCSSGVHSLINQLTEDYRAGAGNSNIIGKENWGTLFHNK